RLRRRRVRRLRRRGVGRGGRLVPRRAGDRRRRRRGGRGGWLGRRIEPGRDATRTDTAGHGLALESESDEHVLPPRLRHVPSLSLSPCAAPLPFPPYTRTRVRTRGGGTPRRTVPPGRESRSTGV